MQLMQRVWARYDLCCMPHAAQESGRGICPDVFWQGGIQHTSLEGMVHNGSFQYSQKVSYKL